MTDFDLAAAVATYRGKYAHGSKGEAHFREENLTTDVLFLTEESVRRPRLETSELDDHLAYLGWSIWDSLAARATEGESQLIPRQEYEALSWLQCWARYPQMIEYIADKVGIDGVIDIGRSGRGQIGSKVNALHVWCAGIGPLLGRGLAAKLGLGDTWKGIAEVNTIAQFQRQLAFGLVGEAPMYASMRGYSVKVLGQEWRDRFVDDIESLDDEQRRAQFMGFNASVELMAFLVHMDNRLGLADSGPYELPDGSRVIVRDLFLHEEEYAGWAPPAEGLPYSITSVMRFPKDADIELSVFDLSTMFTQPRDYLSHVDGVAMYVRDRWDTPQSDIRPLDPDEAERVTKMCRESILGIYQKIAAMSRREKILAGMRTYYVDWMMPYAREAGLWDDLKREFDFFELDPLASDGYYRLTREESAKVVTEGIMLGSFYPPVGDRKYW